MISKEDDIGKTDDWSGISTIETDTGGFMSVQNLDSSMSFAEHQRIAFAARKFLVSFDAGEEHWANRPDDTDKADATTAFANLKDCYETSDSDFTMKISKGIHQPKTDPHMQIRLSSDEYSVLFHLNVSATEADGKPAGLTGRFHWEAHSYSCKFGGMIFSWPENAGEPKKKDTYYRSARRNSISHAGLAAAVREHERAERARIFTERKAKVLGPALNEFIKLKGKGGFPFIKKEHKEVLYSEGEVSIGNRTVAWNEAKGIYEEA